jgi:adenosylhomocysteinase
MSKIKDSSLAARGRQELAWAESHMPVLTAIRNEFKRTQPFKGLKIGIALHLEKKTGILLRTLRDGGATVYGCSCNPNTTDDATVAALAEESPGKLEVFAWAGQSTKEYYWCIDQVLDGHPHIVIDDGCDLLMRLHEQRPEQLKEVIGACEETTTGIVRLKAMQKDNALKLPVYAVNNAHSKYLLDNQFGTAQSALEAIMKATNTILAGKVAVVYGYGWCGRGAASRFKGMGAQVVVVEVEGTLGPHESGQNRALCALYDGYRVLNHADAAREGDIFLTVTGNKNVIRAEHFAVMKDGAILSNAGHFNVEIDEPTLRAMSKKVEEVKDNITAYHIEVKGAKSDAKVSKVDGPKTKTLYLLSEGRLVNLARPSGQGHPMEIMDGSFAIQALCCQLIANSKGKKLASGVMDVPKEVDDAVAARILATRGVTLDKPTKEQVAYANEWKEGT